MSFENPGDGTACDHCGCMPGEVRDGRLGFLAPNRGAQLCSACINAAAQAEIDEATTDPETGLRWITVRDERYRQQTMREIAIEREMRR